MHVSCWQFVFFYKGCRNYRQGRGCCTLFQKEKTEGKAIKGITTSVFFFNNKVTVIHVLRDEEKPCFELDFITADLFEKYALQSDYSIFLCGPAGMYSFLDKQIETR